MLQSLKGWRNVILVFAGIAVGVAGERVAENASGWTLAAALVAWIGGFAAAAGIPVYEHIHRSRQAKDVKKLLVESRRDTRVALNDALDPRSLNSRRS